jgi:hypothetical protein
MPAGDVIRTRRKSSKVCDCRIMELNSLIRLKVTHRAVCCTHAAKVCQTWLCPIGLRMY